jgi:glucose-6-phosphate 1-dehydrogenase
MDEAAGMTRGVAADVLVLFGITGDLARKMLLPALYRLFERGLLEVPVVGVTTRNWDLGALRAHVREAVTAAVAEVDEKTFARFAERLRLVSGVDAHPGAYARLEDAVHGYAAYYLAVPPSLFLPMAKALAGSGLNRQATLVVEKPFGHDLASARELEAGLVECFDDDHLLRVDHFLGDEAVRALATLRENNALLGAVWSREWIESVQITLAEDFGVADRGSFYDPVGCVRDVIQNHLLQVLTFAAMEPARAGGHSQGERMLRLMRAVRAVDPADVVLGQYDGYREVEGVRPDSRTETFAACGCSSTTTGGRVFRSSSAAASASAPPGPRS